MSDTEQLVAPEVKTETKPKPKRVRKPKVVAEVVATEEGAEPKKTKAKGIKKQNKLKCEKKISPEACSHRIYKAYLKRLFLEGVIPDGMKISHAAKISIDNDVAEYDIKLFNDAADVARVTRHNGKTLSAVDIYTTLALRGN